MKTLTYAAAVLAVIAGAAPAMAQVAQPALQNSVVQAPPSALTNVPDPTGQWMLLQGYGKDGEVNFTWYPVMHPDLSRYHGS
jgi:hypothetical protein